MPELDLKIRSQGFGCSELGTCFDVDPFQDLHALYSKKFDGIVQPITKRQIYGHYFEEAILRAASEELGIPMKPSFNQTFLHPDFEQYHLFATPDGLPEDENEGGIECKLAGWDQRSLWGPPDDLVPLMPPRVELQARGNMAVLGKRRWYVAVWCGADQLLIYTVEDDPVFRKFILDRVKQVWATFERRERPPITGSNYSKFWLKATYPRQKRGIRPATDAEIALLTRYSQVRDQYDELLKERLLLENQLKDAIKDREGIASPTMTFTWKRTKDSVEIDWQSMAIGLRTQYLKDPDSAKQEELRQTLTDFYTRTKPGVRRIRFVNTETVEKEEEAVDAA